MVKLYSIATAAFIAGSYAAPTYLNPNTRSECDAIACGIAAGPTGVGCVSAAVKLGADPFSDAACVVGLINLGVNTPGSCELCIELAKEKIPELFEDAKDAVEDVIDDVIDDVTDNFDDVKDTFTSLFPREECDPVKCGIAAGPAGVSCISAAVKLGADPFADAKCVAGLTILGVKVPEACQPCVEEAKQKIPEFFEDVQDVVTGILGEVTDDIAEGFDSIFSRDTCNIVQCGAAAGPTGVDCVTAAVKLGADPFDSASCVAGVVNLGVNVPDACQPCIDAVKDKFPEIFEDIKDTVTDIFDDVKDSATEVFEDVVDDIDSIL